jgi:hypothetical protein
MDKKRKKRKQRGDREKRLAEKLLRVQNEAARKIQGMYLSWRARRNIRMAAATMYEELVDPESGEPYYLNLKTGETKWVKPTWYEPPKRDDEKIGMSDVGEANKLLEKFREERKVELENPTKWPLVFPSGNKYEGMVDYLGKLQGAGCLITINDGRYIGEFSKNKRNGMGVMVYPDGSTYSGAWMNGLQHGHGVKTERDGAQYIGSFKLGVRSGLGVYRSSIGLYYEGTFSNDMFHGYGVQFMLEPDHYHGYHYRAGLWEKGLFQNVTPRFCCDIPEGQQTQENIDEAKVLGFRASLQARKNIPVALATSKRANDARLRANDERKRTILTTDMENLALLKGSQSRKDGEESPFLDFLEIVLHDTKRRQAAAERRVAYQETMANLAEQQWVAAKSFNDQLNLEKLTASQNLKEAEKFEPLAKEKWTTIAEMRETLLQLRIALHINKNKHRVLDRKARENKQRAENIQKRLNTVVANVNRSRQKVTSLVTETDSRYNTNINRVGGYRSPMNNMNVMRALPMSHNNYSMSRGALTTAGSSMAGVSPPPSPVNKPVTKRESKLHNLS